MTTRSAAARTVVAGRTPATGRTPAVARTVAAVALAGLFLSIAPASAQDGVPQFEVDASWPRLPDGWVLGQVASVVVDARDHVWVLHRPRTVAEEERANAAPPVIELGPNGSVVRAWGGATDDRAWPGNEHGIHVDASGHVWVGGNSGADPSDDMLLKLAGDGTVALQIGRRGESLGNDDTTNLRRPAESFVYEASGEVFVADGYGNRRVIVLDAETGEFQRMWGAFGNALLDPPPAGQAPAAETDPEDGPPQFGIVHGIEVSNDGLVYVADRNNSRIQIFDADGTFVRQAFVNRGAESALTVAGLAFSPDPEQRFVYVADQGNSHIHVLDRATLEPLDSFGRNGAAPGEFQALHHIASDSQGNLYTAEAQRGRRVQKFTLTGFTPTDEARGDEAGDGAAGDGPAGGHAAGARWTAPRTAWGEPDLQGLWTSATLTPLERPESQAEGSTLTDEEAASIEAESAARRAASDGKSAPGSVGGYNQVWMDAGTRIVGDRRTSLIVDPPDGRIPWLPHARVASDRERARYGVGPFESYTDLDTGERCITDGLPNMVPLQPYNMNMHIFQSPGEVVMLHEMYHELRVIPLDGRARNGIPQWTGEARGHWEGDTLVVETVNFAERPKAYWSAPWRASRPSLRLVERFTRVGPETIDYTFTLEDPLAFTRPWTAAAPMTTDHASRGVTAGQLWEYACHEGNYGMLNILRGARAEEAEAAAAER
ncbi:MAG: hypothetical protein OXH04_23535 [Acidobacteria bacterium]|nr:hypothetical protein [Acidobacteriota bacterium]